MKITAGMRAIVACVALVMCFTVFSGRLIYLQVEKHSEYSALAAEKHTAKQISFAKRGIIQDANGEVLADNEPVKTVVADCTLIKDPGAVAELLAAPLVMKAGDLEEMLSSGRRYVVIKKRVSESVADAVTTLLRKNSVRGIYFEQDAVRVYPNGDMLCHVLGFMDHQHAGIQGIEKTMDQYLRGHDGFRFIEHDRTGKEIFPYRGQERSARAGCNVRLTIDMALQQIVEGEIGAAYEKYKPKMAVAILMRPATGEILAMANRPHFDLNALGDNPDEKMKNRAIIDMMEPGSVFKIVTIAAALNEKLVKPDTMIFCDNGAFTYAGRTLHDHAPYAELSALDILVKSSNIGVAHLALRLGDQRLHEYIRRFGFGERTGVNLPGEINGLIHPLHKWSKVSITHIPMGHEVGVTPLQMVTAMSAIANGGRLMMPQIIQEITDEEGKSVAKFPPVEIRRVVSSETAAQVRAALRDVVSKRGTAELAGVPGYTDAGKTGTAQIPSPQGGYLEGKYILSFIGFLPAENPEFVGLVLLQEPHVTNHEENYGGRVAAPIFAQIAGKAARYLNILPDPTLVAPAKSMLTESRVNRR